MCVNMDTKPCIKKRFLQIVMFLQQLAESEKAAEPAAVTPDGSREDAHRWSELEDCGFIGPLLLEVVA